MRSPTEPFERITLPFRTLTQRVSLLFLITFAFALLFLGQAEIFVFERARQVATDMSAPLLELVAKPVSAITQALERTDEYLYVFEENRRLREENMRLRNWQDQALRLESKLSRLEALLDVQLDPAIRYVTARVVGDTGGPFVHTILLNVGQAGGIQPGQAVVSEDGFVGRVVSVGSLASRVLLVTDLNSRVPVFVEPGHYRAIVAGNNSATPHLEFLPGKAQVRPGDRVVTSGHGGFIPPGLHVGVVSAAGKEMQVRPSIYEGIPDFVRVLRFAFPLDVERSTETDPQSPIFEFMPPASPPALTPAQPPAPAQIPNSARPPAATPLPAPAVATPLPAPQPVTPRATPTPEGQVQPNVSPMVPAPDNEQE